MPPMRISTIPASDQDLGRAGEWYGLPWSGGTLMLVVALLAGGGAAALAGVWITVHSFWGVPLALAGCLAVAAGVCGLLNVWVEVESAREGKAALERVRREGVELVEIEVVRAFSTCGADEDVAAAVLVDGHGGAVYLNSNHLETYSIMSEVEGGVPRRLKVRVAAGWILEWEAEGPPITPEDGPDDPPIGGSVEAAVLKPSEVSAAWVKVLRGPR